MATLSPQNASLIDAVNKLNKYVCAYPTRSANISDALSSVGCRKMNKLFELAEAAQNDHDATKVKSAIHNLSKTIEQYASRSAAVGDALKVRGSKLLSQIEDMAKQDGNYPN